MSKLIVFALAAMTAFALATPAFATGSAGSGAAFGDHHATMAQEMSGFSADMNPGMHTGFAGWTAH